MKLKWICLLPIVAACSHQPSSTGSKEIADRVFKKYAPEMVAEMRSRQPAAQSDQQSAVAAKLDDLAVFKPQKFEIYVFPKKTSITEKSLESDENETLLGKPTVIEVSAQVVSSCQFLIEKGFKKLRPQAYFPKELAKDKKRKCGIVTMTSKALRGANKSLLKNGDEMAKRIYLDDTYRVYGIETDFYGYEGSSLRMKTRGSRYTSAAPASSSMSYFPTDLPSFKNLPDLRKADLNEIFGRDAATDGTQNVYKNFDTQIDTIAMNQILRINKEFKPSCGNLMATEYKDMQGAPVKVFWCRGFPWPSVVENNQFVAVTQQITPTSQR